MSRNDALAQQRGIAGIMLLVVPILSIAAIGSGYVLLVFFGVQGRAAEGPLVRYQIHTCDAAQPLIVRRVEAMGLPDVQVGAIDGGFSLTARLPSEARVQEAIPATLTAPGHFEVVPATGGDALAGNADLAEAEMTLAFLDAPYVRLKLHDDAAKRLEDYMKSDMEGGIALYLDGERVITRKNMPAETRGRLDLDLVGGTDLARMDFAAAAAIQLQHGPLPCEAQVVDAQEVGAPPED